MRIVRIAGKVIVGAALLAAIGVLVVLLWARSESGRRTVRGIAVDETRRVLPGLSIGRIGGDLTRNIVLEDVHIRDRAGRDAVTIERVEARLDLLALIHHQVRVEHLLLVRPRVDAHANLGEIAQRQGGGGAVYDFELQSIELQDGSYVSDGLAARGVSARGTLRLGARGLAATVTALAGQAQTGERVFAVDGKGGVTSSGGRTQVAIDRLAVSGALPAPLAFHGRVDGAHIDTDVAIGAAGHAHVIADLGGGYRARVDVTADPHDLDAALAAGHLDAHITASGHGWPLAPKSHADASIQLARSRIEGIAITRAELRGHTDGRAWRLDDADVRALGLAIRARGHGERAQLALALDAYASRPVRLLGASAAGRLKVTLAGHLPGPFEVASNFDLSGVQFAHDRIERLRGTARLTLRQRWRASTLHALHLVAQNPTLAGHALLATVEIDAVAKPALQVTAEVRGHDLSLHLANAPLHWNQRGVQLGPAALSADVAGVSLPDARVSASVDARWRNVAIDVGGHLGASRAPVRLHGRVPFALRGPMELALEAEGVRLAELPSLVFARRELRDGRIDVHLQLEGDAQAPRGQLELALRDARIGHFSGLAASVHARAENDRITLDGAAFEHSRRVLTWNGSWQTGLGPLVRAQVPWQAKLALHAKLAGLDLAKLHALDPRLAHASGAITGEASVEGTLRDPSARVRLDASGAQLDVVRFAQLQASVELDKSGVRGSLLARPAAGGKLAGQLTWGPRRHAITLQARALDLRFVPALAGGIREMAGTLDGDLTIADDAGTAATGTLALHKGHLGLRGLHDMNDIELAIRFAPGRADITRLEARSGGGTLSGTGSATLEGLVPTKVALSAAAKQFELGYGGLVHARLDGRIEITGATVDDRLALRARVEQGRLGLEQIGGEGDLQPTGPLADVRFVDAAGLAAARETPGGKRPVRGIARDLELAILLPDFGVRGKEITAALDGHVTVAASPDGLPVLSGQIAVRRGSVEVFGQRFEIEHARVQWSGEPGDVDPAIDIRVTRAFADATVAVELTGTLARPDIHLASDPPIYDQTQLVAMVLGGEPQSDLGQTASPAGTLSSVILAQIVDKIAPQLPLDVLRVDLTRESAVAGAPAGINDVTETRVEVGKHLTDRITLSYVHLFGAPENQNHNEARVDYRLGRRWIVETAFGDAGVGGADVFWTWRY